MKQEWQSKADATLGTDKRSTEGTPAEEGKDEGAEGDSGTQETETTRTAKDKKQEAPEIDKRFVASENLLGL